MEEHRFLGLSGEALPHCELLITSGHVRERYRADADGKMLLPNGFYYDKAELTDREGSVIWAIESGNFVDAR